MSNVICHGGVHCKLNFTSIAFWSWQKSQLVTQNLGKKAYLNGKIPHGVGEIKCFWTLGELTLLIWTTHGSLNHKQFRKEKELAWLTGWICTTVNARAYCGTSCLFTQSLNSLKAYFLVLCTVHPAWLCSLANCLCLPNTCMAKLTLQAAAKCAHPGRRTPWLGEERRKKDSKPAWSITQMCALNLIMYTPALLFNNKECKTGENTLLPHFYFSLPPFLSSSHRHTHRHTDTHTQTRMQSLPGG